ncbi:IclR family transcriptional regulator [Marmoricola sp. RAF53]|uniref:IclR family transcriptional regulator n=1 Tax=Marmoricola sp. RAF53 TaxID=3233059 RepID=UPI003F9E6CFE
MPANNEGQRGTTRTLLRGLTLLEMISEAREGATVTELAAGSDLDKGTVSRLLSTLRDAGWAYQSEDRRYRLAGKALALSHDYTNRVDLRALAMPLLSELRDEWNETVHLGVIEGNEVVYVERLAPTASVQVVSIVGQRMPIASTAMGRAFLSALPAEERERRAKEQELVARTERSITDPADFLAEVITSAERGYAVDREENDVETTCVGSAVTDVSGRPIATISVSGPSYRMNPQVEKVGHSCAEAAASISAALGDASKQ